MMWCANQAPDYEGKSLDQIHDPGCLSVSIRRRAGRFFSTESAMKLSIQLRVFGAVNLVLTMLFIVLSYSAGRSLAREFLVAPVPIAMMSFGIIAFTVWLLTSSVLMLFARGFSSAALFWNGAVFVLSFGFIGIKVVSEHVRHDSSFAVLICIVLLFVFFGLSQLAAVLRAMLKKNTEGRRSILHTIFHPAVFPVILVLALSGPLLTAYFHFHGVLRPCFVSKVSASSETPGHAASLMCDGNLLTYWSPSGNGGEGSSVRIEFPFNETVEGVVCIGAPDVREFRKRNRIRSGVLVFSDGTKKTFELADSPSVQNVPVTAKDVRWMTMTVTSVYAGESEAVLAAGTLLPLHRVKIFR